MANSPSAESLLRHLIHDTDDLLDSILPGCVSAALPGTPEKVEVMTLRAWKAGKNGVEHLSGKSVFHPDDLTCMDCLLLGIVRDIQPANGAPNKDGAASTEGARVVVEAEGRDEIDLEIVHEKELRREARLKKLHATRQAAEG